MKTFSCPSCGAEVVFQSTSSVFTVCKFCKSTLIRKDLNLESLGKMADLKDDATVFQIGTTGKYKGQFMLLGRVRCSWDDGFWNEWFVRYDDGREAWLAEAQGFLMLSTPVESKPALPTVDKISPGVIVTIGKIDYQVDDVKKITYSFAEGELPFRAPQGYSATSIDLRHGENDFASLSFGGDGAVDVFVGVYLEFDQLHFDNLKAVDGW